MKSFSRGLVVCCAVVGCAFVDLVVIKGPLRARLMRGRGDEAVAEVCGQPIMRLELEEALREHLWRRNESWVTLGTEAQKQTRRLVLDGLINDRLIRAARAANDALQTDARSESDMMRRQFANLAEFPQRLAAQRQTQQSLDVLIRDAQLDEQWIAKRIAAQLAEVTEVEIRTWYDKSKEKLRIPQAHHAAHIFLTRHDKTKPDRESEIRTIHRQLITKEKTFAVLAAEHSDDDRTKTIGGDLGWITRERMPVDFMAAVEKLKIGQLSDLVPTMLGWHLIIVMERRESRLPTFEEAWGEISALLTSQRRNEAVKNLISELRQHALPAAKYPAEVIDRAEPAP